MAKTTTTLAGAITAGEPTVNITNKAALRAGDNVVIGTETMRVLIADPTVPAVVFRGSRGTAGQAAAAGAAVNYGPPTDWGAGVGVLLVENQAAHTALVAEAHEEYQQAIEKKNVELKVEAEKASAKAAAEAKAADAAADKAAADAEKAAARK